MEQKFAIQQETHTETKTKKVSYWIITGLVAFELVFGAMWDFNVINKSYVRGIMSHLGFPEYVDLLLGITKIPAAVVLLVPGFLVLKEWAYAGTVFIFAGAVFAHLAVGDGFAGAIFPAIYGALTFISYWLRPAERRLKV